MVGPRFDAALLRTIASDPARVRGQLDPLLDAELIDEELGSELEAQFRFTQSLLQDVIYQNLLMQRRMELHGRVGRALEARVPAGGRAARGPDRPRPPFLPERGEGERGALPQYCWRSSQCGLRQRGRYSPLPTGARRPAGG